MCYIHGNKYNTATKRNGQEPFVSIWVHLKNVKLSGKKAVCSKIPIKWDDSFEIPTSMVYISMEGDT